MGLKGIGIVVPIIGMSLPTEEQSGVGEERMIATKGVGNEQAGVAEDGPSSAASVMQRRSPMSVHREGNHIYAKTSRTSYHAVVGQVYTPFGSTKDSAPKMLHAVGLVGDEWQVSIGPADGSRGRTRGMQLASFLMRYVEGTAIVNPRRRARVEERTSGSRLDRIERKLDLLLEQLLGAKATELLLKKEG